MKQYEKTGALIAAARKERGLTQKALAQALHISDTTVSKWERGIGFPDVSLVEPLASALGLTIAELFAGERAAEPLPQECETLLSGVLAESTLRAAESAGRIAPSSRSPLACCCSSLSRCCFSGRSRPAVLRGTYVASGPRNRSLWRTAGSALPLR